MHGIGIALAFLVFWSFVAVGVFLVMHGARQLRGSPGGLGRRLAGAVAALLGFGLAAAGAYATLVLLRGR